MPVAIALIVMYMTYENTFHIAEKEIITAHNIVCVILLVLMFISICLRIV